MSGKKMTDEQKKAHSERIKAVWAKKKAEKLSEATEIQKDLPRVIPDMKTPDIQAKKVAEPKVIEVSKNKPFLEIEEVAEGVDGLEVINRNPNYYYRWCRESDVGTGRTDIWNVLDRKHPDFSGLRVNIDHSPDKSFIRFKDLILCCARIETREKKRKALDAKVANSATQVKNKLVRDVDKTNKGLAHRTGVVQAFSSIDRTYK